MQEKSSFNHNLKWILGQYARENYMYVEIKRSYSYSACYDL